ncbi:hypothetical protein [Actinomadura sp. B10D3]|uniref:hypothetical protein n=1 Tax=Actinomadura sp. B10D3 TaxID=3153557 RepID=UPI00325E7564
MPRRTTWGALGALAPTLTCSCLLGLWAMSALQARADRARELDCLHGRAAQWSHGYGAWLPVAVLAGAALAAVLAVAVLAAGRRSPTWARTLCYPASALAVLALFPAGMKTLDHFSFPGSDISSVGSPPCGVGSTQVRSAGPAPSWPASG